MAINGKSKTPQLPSPLSLTTILVITLTKGLLTQLENNLTWGGWKNPIKVKWEQMRNTYVLHRSMVGKHIHLLFLFYLEKLFTLHSCFHTWTLGHLLESPAFGEAQFSCLSFENINLSFFLFSPTTSAEFPNKTSYYFNVLLLLKFFFFWREGERFECPG